MELSERQNKILEFIIREFAKNERPIGSLELAEKLFSELSPATIRSELSLLSNSDYLEQPHTSAGRIPTDKAYRWFVNRFIENEGKLNKESSRWSEKIREKNEVSNFEPSEIISRFCRGLGVYYDFDTGISKSGMSSLFFGLPDLEKKEIKKVFDDIEFLDNQLENFFDDFGEFERIVFIGKESPITKSENLSLVSRFYSLPKRRGVFLLLGPKNMLYDRNLAVLEALSDLMID